MNGREREEARRRKLIAPKLETEILRPMLLRDYSILFKFML